MNIDFKPIYEPRHNEIAEVEFYGKQEGDYAQLTQPVIDDLNKNYGFGGLTRKEVLSDPELYNMAVTAYWQRLDDFGIPEEDKALWWLMPGNYKKYKGNVEAIDKGMGPYKTADELKKVMRDRQKKIEALRKRR